MNNFNMTYSSLIAAVAAIACMVFQDSPFTHFGGFFLLRSCTWSGYTWATAEMDMVPVLEDGGGYFSWRCGGGVLECYVAGNSTSGLFWNPQFCNSYKVCYTGVYRFMCSIAKWTAHHWWKQFVYMEDN